MTVPVADSLGMTEPYGAIFDRPDTGSPAANAGIEAGDVVTAINGTPLMNWHEFATNIAAISPGTVVYLSTSRNGESKEINLTLGYGTCPRERAGQTHGRTAFAAPDRRKDVECCRPTSLVAQSLVSPATDESVPPITSRRGKALPGLRWQCRQRCQHDRAENHRAATLDTVRAQLRCASRSAVTHSSAGDQGFGFADEPKVSGSRVVRT
jgi:hypothetical protein